MKLGVLETMEGSRVIARSSHTLVAHLVKQPGGGFVTRYALRNSRRRFLGYVAIDEARHIGIRLIRRRIKPGCFEKEN